jgi:hypothetical protein
MLVNSIDSYLIIKGIKPIVYENTETS